MRALDKLSARLAKHGVSSTTAIIAGAISASSVQAAPVALAKSVTAVAIVKSAAASAYFLFALAPPSPRNQLLRSCRRRRADAFANSQTGLIQGAGSVENGLSKSGERKISPRYFATLNPDYFFASNFGSAVKVHQRADSRNMVLVVRSQWAKPHC